MTPLEILKQAQTERLIDDDGEPVTLELEPGLTEEELRVLEAQLPCPIPEEMQELLRYYRAIDGMGMRVGFDDRDSFGLEEVFPHGVPIAGDGFGNLWVVDLNPSSREYGPIWYACHDAPVILYQSATLSEFLIELFNMYRPPRKSLVDDVHEDRIRKVWVTNPGVLEYEQCVSSTDDALRQFAAELDDTFQIIDLRDAQPGDGFSWGRYGAQTVIRRFGYEPIWAYQRKDGLLKRLIGGLTGKK